MERKKCKGCDKEFFREEVLNNWKTYKIKISDKQWKRKIFCSRKCARNFYQKKRYRTDEKYREKHKNYCKNLTPEKKKEYYENSKEKRKEREIFIKKHYPEKIKKRNKIAVENHINRRGYILKKYNYKCAICGFDKVKDIHHIDKNKLIVLCPNHHHMFHRGILDKKEILKYWVM